jgi:vancomycin resistance protein YoaR
MPVHYVPAGCDATVAYGSIDFKFRNDTSGPVLVAAKTRGGRLSFGLYGVEAPTEKQVRVIAGSRRYRDGGFSVSTLRRVVEADGTVRNESLGSDSYRFLASEPSTRPRRTVRRRASVVSKPRPAEETTSASASGESPV